MVAKLVIFFMFRTLLPKYFKLFTQAYVQVISPLNNQYSKQNNDFLGQPHHLHLE